MNDNNKIPPYFHSTKQFVSFYISQSQPLPQVLCGYEKHNNQQKLTAFLLLFYLFLTRTSWDSILVGLWPWKWDQNGEEVKLSMWLLTVDTLGGGVLEGRVETSSKLKHSQISDPSGLYFCNLFYLRNKCGVAMHLFSNRSQMSTKCGKKKKGDVMYASVLQ